MGPRERCIDYCLTGGGQEMQRLHPRRGLQVQLPAGRGRQDMGGHKYLFVRTCLFPRSTHIRCLNRYL